MTRTARIKLSTTIAVGLVGAVAIVGAAPGVASGDVAARVTVDDNFFDPRSVTVAPGESVKWIWKGDTRHNVIFRKAPEGADKPRIKARSEGRATRSFEIPGVYRYVCTLYNGMEGSVTVADEG